MTGRPTKTDDVRLHLDLRLRTPMDGDSLHVIAAAVAEAAQAHVHHVKAARWSQIIPAEPDFDWQQP